MLAISETAALDMLESLEAIAHAAGEIQGNEEQVERIKHAGCQIFERIKMPTYGHPKRDEIKKMYQRWKNK